MTGKFEVSVIIPVYNAAAFIAQAVNSALAQPEVKEVILVEDHSPDDSLAVCQQLVYAQSHVRLYQHPGGVNRGAGPSRNLGISKSTCPFIAFLDADDFFLPNRFTFSRAVYDQHTDCDGVYDAVGMYYADEASRERWRKNSITSEGVTTVESGVDPSDLFSVLIKGGLGHIHLNGLVIHRQALGRSGLMDESIADTLHEDTDWILRLASVCRLYPGSVIEPTSMRRVHQQNRVSAPRSPLLIQRDRLRLCVATYSWLRKNGTVEQRRLAFRRLMRQWFTWPEVRTQAAKLRSLISFAWKYPVSILEPDYWIEGKDALLNYLRKEKIEQL